MSLLDENYKTQLNQFFQSTHDTGAYNVANCQGRMVKKPNFKYQRSIKKWN